MTLECPTGQSIFVVEAHYGQYGYTSTQDDLTCKPPNPQYDCVERMEENRPTDWMIMKELCDGETSCTFFAQIGLMSTCGESIDAEFTDVVYQCLPGKYLYKFFKFILPAFLTLSFFKAQQTQLPLVSRFIPQ